MFLLPFGRKYYLQITLLFADQRPPRRLPPRLLLPAEEPEGLALRVAAPPRELMLCERLAPTEEERPEPMEERLEPMEEERS